MENLPDALAKIARRAQPTGLEKVGLDRALGRVLARDARARFDAPSFDNSAMDGYAVRSIDLEHASKSAPRMLPVIGESAAGASGVAKLAPRTVARIFTGAPVPAGADAVVAQEDVERAFDQASFRAPVTPGRHIRRRASDVTAGSVIVPCGTTVRTAERAILAGQGHATIDVARRPRVAVVSTGNELVDVGEHPGPGQIIDSNTWLLAGAIEEAGGEPTVLARCSDDLAATRSALEEASLADIVISVGGASVGDHDYVRRALADLEVALEFERVRLKPGKPTAFGTLGAAPRSTLFFALPGNPVSAAVTFEIFVRPTIRRMLGDPRPHRPITMATLSEGYEPSRGRTELARAHLDLGPDTAQVQLHRSQGSGALHALSGINALVIFPAGTGPIPPGTPVRAIRIHDTEGSESSPFRDGD